MLSQYATRYTTAAAIALTTVLAAPRADAVDLNLSDVPLFLSPAVAPLNLLVVGRDHKLYYEAYNDAADLNGDGSIDVGYKGYLPAASGGIDYYGYFDSYKCYTHDGARFNPTRTNLYKACGGASEWSGDYLNYLTSSRIDALRKVLYGGKRVLDTAAATVLERSHVPMDAHSWGKEYTSIAVDGYDIRDYTPYSAPAAGRRHLFANTTPNTAAEEWYNNNVAPLLRVLLDSPYRKWEWASKESPVAGTRITPLGAAPVTVTPTDLIVRVSACVAGLLGTESCQQYASGNYKPIGLLHEFGENDAMLFGLLTGSYTANKSGGVLRKNIGSFTDEISPNDGTLTNTVGVIRTLDRLRAAAYTRYIDSGADVGGTSYDCGLPAMAVGPPADGNCRMWGNPVAEMMYEGLRYFRGMSPTSAFTAIYGSSNTDIENSARLNLPRPGWSNPYQSRPVCSKPFETVMADINNSYDSDQLPGSVFPLETGSNPLSNALPGLNVATLADQITANEPDVPGLRFIGQSGTAAGSYDGAPTPKPVTSLSNIRGLAPEEPTKQGSYYSASVAYHGLTNDISTSATGDQNVQTFAVALASPLPKIEIPVGGRTVTLVPFAKSVQYGSSINRAQGAFQPTNQIVDFYVEALAGDRSSGTFQVNFEDVEAGNDHDMDAIVRYQYQVNGDSTVTVNVSADYQAGSIIHHLGYVISGTTADGVYLVVQDCNKGSSGAYTCNGADPDYFLDTPPGFGPGQNPSDGQPLPGFSTRTFSPGTAAAATLLKDPLWYAAKWGGFQDSNGNDLPDVQSEWDNDPAGSVGHNVPDNYFLVTNALTLSQQLREAFEEIVKRTSSASSASVNSGSISTNTRVYQARFDTRDWTGQLLAFGVDPTTGVVNSSPTWDASRQLPAHGARDIITVNSDGITAVPFRSADLDPTSPDLDPTRQAQLTAVPAAVAAYVDFLRGDDSQEGVSTTYQFRERPSKLGDIVSSSPLYVGMPRLRYSDSLELQPYSAFVADNRDRQAIVYAGANDGMLHAFHADTGREMFAFIPGTVFRNLRQLTSPNYTHRYFVDGAPNSGDVFFNGAWHTVLVGGLNKGGQGVYALNITNPAQLDAAEGAADNIFLWEFTDLNDRDLGLTYSQPAIVRLHDRSWAAVFGNGYNNTAADGNQSLTGNAVLYIVDIETGNIIRKFDTGVGTADDPTGAARPNGLATPVMVDVNGDRIVDHAYAGDLFGNLWKFDLRSASSTSWDFAFRDPSNEPQPFFTARDGASPSNAQPITVRPEVARGPRGAGVMVLFGTGKYLEPDDRLISPTRVQTFYGLIDRNTYTAADRITSRADLQQQTILSEPSVDPDGAGPKPARRVRITSNYPRSGSGWYLDLLSPASGYQGEKQVTDPAVRGDKVIFTTLMPDVNPCNFGGTSWLMELDLLDGSRLAESPLDTNGDGVIDLNDRVNGEVASGVQGDQILSRPAILTCLSGDCVDRKLSSGSSGTLFEISEVSDRGSRGRQSWRQIR